MSGLGGFSMWDLFRGEVESQMKVLTHGLLAIDAGDPPSEHLASAMRAAHSIKGAARIVQLDEGVRLAHVMEDCLVAAQDGSVSLTGAGIDVLLAGGDLLSKLSAVAEADVPQWVADQAGPIEALVGQLTQVRAGTLSGPVAPAVAVATEAAPIAASSESGKAVSSDPAPRPPDGAASAAPGRPETRDRVLKVGAQNLNRLMGLAGESLVQSHWFEPFSEALLMLKRRQHDIAEVLDTLHATLERDPGEIGELVSEARTKLDHVRQATADRHAEFEVFALRSSRLSDRLYGEVVATRMRPFGDGVEGFPRLVRDVSRQLGKQAKLEILGRSTEVDREILERLEAPLNHMIRNSLDHGLEMPDQRVAAGKPAAGTIRLEARHRAGLFVVTVSDDGRGVDVERLRVKVVERELATSEMAANFSEAELLEFLFLPGFSTASKVTDLSGRGVGLDAVQDMAKSVGGGVRLTSRLGQGITISLELPLTLSVVRTLVVQIGAEPFAIPLTRITKTVMVSPEALVSFQGHQCFSLDGERIGVVSAHDVLGMSSHAPRGDQIPVVLIGDRSERYGVVVDRLMGEYDMVVRPLDPRLGKVQDISASALMDDGTPLLILDVDDLLRSVAMALESGGLRGLGHTTAPEKARRRVLVVDDSITVRELERTLLKNRGYEVDVAVDGMDGWNAIRSGSYDLIVSDVDMPRMTGIELVAQIKADSRLQATPVIIVSYKDREEDRLKGLEAGADRYMTKSSFHDQTFLSAVEALIGPPE